MYQDTDFGKDVLAGVVLQTEAMKMQIAGTTAHKPTDTDFTASIAKVRGANCDRIVLGTIVRDSTLILSTARKAGWNVDFMGQIASYDTAIATAPGNVAEGYYAMSPSLYAYPDDPRPEVQSLMKRFKDKYGFDINYLGETGYVSAQIAPAGPRRA